jgi:hypothetical protein
MLDIITAFRRPIFGEGDHPEPGPGEVLVHAGVKPREGPFA